MKKLAVKMPQRLLSSQMLKLLMTLRKLSHKFQPLNPLKLLEKMRIPLKKWLKIKKLYWKHPKLKIQNLKLQMPFRLSLRFLRRRMSWRKLTSRLSVERKKESKRLSLKQLWSFLIQRRSRFMTRRRFNLSSLSQKSLLLS